ncbi:YjiH family protein [Shewanella sp. SNU WT4]|uniref:YjiH family protein n=1 Tax=Shewanella sp. SNU WT4 TaxID=2590015 RepID=UPI00143DA6E3|nr:YjiH family protein [Shewanella sp. SNU WT4]
MATEQQKYSLKTMLTFIVPSFIGILLFMIPVSYQDAITIPVAVIAKGLLAALGAWLPSIITVVVCMTALFSVLFKLWQPKWFERHHFIRDLFSVHLLWIIVRILGAIFIVMSLLKVGPEAIISGSTGSLVLNDLLPILFCVFLFAGMLLPLLLNFGLLELLGALLTKIMRPLFNLPGRSAIDCMTSWLGDGSVGILLTTKQYEEKFYTQREAAVIGTTFSAVSITFSLVIISQVNLAHMFAPFYLTVCLAGLAAAIIVPRLPPLSRKKDAYIDGTPRSSVAELKPTDKSLLGWGLDLAMQRAQNSGGVKQFLNEGVKNAVDMIFGVLPVVMGIGTLALIVAEYTPIFTWLGMPFIPFLELLQIPEAAEASKTIVVGFADMFIPSILAASIESDMTRFVIAAMSVTQLIYMSEVGALLLGSKIPVNFAELFMIFILRTLITLPVIAGMAHLFF